MRPPSSRPSGAPARREVDGARFTVLVRETLAAGESLWVPGRGNSMWPTIRDGDQVLVEPVTGPIRRGDVVLIERARALVLHRVVRGGAQVVTQGDASLRPDAPAATDRVLGRAVAVWSGGRLRALLPTLRLGGAPAIRWIAPRVRLQAARLWRRILALAGGAPEPLSSARRLGMPGGGR